MDHPIRRIQDTGPPKYDVNEEKFSVILHYKGAMCLDGYYGGEVDCFDWCKLDSISLSVFDRWIQELCGEGYVRYYYKPNGYVYRGSLRPLDSDSDVFEMCLSGGKINRQIDVYVNHFTEDIVAELDENGSPYRYVEADEGGEKDVDVEADLVEGVDVPSGQLHEEPEDELFHDPDYNIPDDDVDFEDIVNEETNIGNKPGRRSGSSTSQHESEIHIPEVEFEYDSEYGDSEELDSSVDSDEDACDRIKFPEFIEEKHMEKPVILHGMKFRNFDQFKRACKNWGINNRWDLWFPTNDKLRCICKCRNPLCNFRLYASKVSNDDPTVQIKTSNFSHSCSKIFKSRNLTSQFIASKYYDKFRVDHSWSLNGIRKQVQDDMGLQISRMKAWRAKDMAFKWIYGDENLQYRSLLRYQAELMATNSDTTAVIWREESKFMGFYVCLGPLKKAWICGCRPIISIDACWLKGTFGGNLLTAVGIDPNDCIFPIAYAVIDGVESTKTWSWFLCTLSYDLEIIDSSKICWMSDRQKGLINAVHDLFPGSEHRNCVRHIYQNFREKFKGKTLKDMVWNAARATSSPQFKKAMDLLKKENEDAFNWLEHPDRPYHSWTRSLFKTHTKCDMLLNNLCECFNRYILQERDMHVITILEMIKSKLMKRMYNKSEMIKNYSGRICPKVEKKFKKIIDAAAFFEVQKSGGAKVQVIGLGGPYVVDLVEMTCTCRRWELTGLPCLHATAGIISNNGNPYDYVSDYYSVETFKKVYSHYINPTNSQDLWPEATDDTMVIPPKPRKKKRGRRPTCRRKQPEEIEQMRAKKKVQREAVPPHDTVGTQKLSKKGSTSNKCSLCGQDGHNARRHGSQNKRFKTEAEAHPDPPVPQDTVHTTCTQETISQLTQSSQIIKKKRSPRKLPVKRGKAIPSRYKGQSSSRNQKKTQG